MFYVSPFFFPFSRELWKCNSDADFAIVDTLECRMTNERTWVSLYQDCEDGLIGVLFDSHTIGTRYSVVTIV